MASILTAEDVVRRIFAECTFIDERGAVGIRLEPAAAIVAPVQRSISGTATQAGTPAVKTAASPMIARGKQLAIPLADLGLALPSPESKTALNSQATAAPVPTCLR